MNVYYETREGYHMRHVPKKTNFLILKRSNIEAIRFDLKNHPGLELLDISDNHIKKIDICFDVKTLIVRNNDLAEMKLGGAVKVLIADNNKLSDVEFPLSLKVLNISNNLFTNLNLAEHIKLINIIARRNQIHTVNLPPKLTILDLENNNLCDFVHSNLDDLKYLLLKGNQISNILISNNLVGITLSDKYILQVKYDLDCNDMFSYKYVIMCKNDIMTPKYYFDLSISRYSIAGYAIFLYSDKVLHVPRDKIDERKKRYNRLINTITGNDLFYQQLKNILAYR